MKDSFHDRTKILRSPAGEFAVRCEQQSFRDRKKAKKSFAERQKDGARITFAAMRGEIEVYKALPRFAFLPAARGISTIGSSPREREFWISYPSIEDWLPPLAWAKCKGIIGQDTVRITFAHVVHMRGPRPRRVVASKENPLFFDRSTGLQVGSLPFARDWRLSNDEPPEDLIAVEKSKNWLSQLICMDQSNFVVGS